MSCLHFPKRFSNTIWAQNVFSPPASIWLFKFNCTRLLTWIIPGLILPRGRARPKNVQRLRHPFEIFPGRFRKWCVVWINSENQLRPSVESSACAETKECCRTEVFPWCFRVQMYVDINVCARVGARCVLASLKGVCPNNLARTVSLCVAFHSETRNVDYANVRQ